MPAESSERSVRVPPRQLDRILVAVDGSPASGHATTFAVDLAADHGATLLFVHVVRAFELDASDEEDLVAIPRQPSERDRGVLDDAAAAAADRGVRAETALLPGRATAEEIVAHGKANDVDMIIVGSSGHGAVRSTLLGNVPLGVLRRSTRPVLIVRGDIPFHAEPT
jgi:nucleotide-binding universal stress UspA family protein